MMSIPPDATRVSRLVIRAPNWLGDAVLALPAIGAIRRHFADARLTVAATTGVAPLFREDTDARPDEVVELAESPSSAIATLQAFSFRIRFDRRGRCAARAFPRAGESRGRCAVRC
jgi:ADP-heptose:LPS heptosyltransferase